MLLGGFLIYGIGALIMLFAYRFGSLSVLQPVLSSSYVFSTVMGVVILKESMTLSMLVGIFLIIISVILIGTSEK